MHPVNDIRGAKGDSLAGRSVVLAVTGSIAAVEAVKLARELARHGARVFPVMSEAARAIIHEDALWFATGERPVTRLTGAVEHVSLCGEVAGRADLLLICPATANTISKMAMGIDDTPVTTCATTAIGSGMPVVVVPAMHGTMYRHPKVLENIEALKRMGILFVDPRLEERKAKVASIERVVAEVRRALSPGLLSGKRVAVAYGGTREPVDDVRFLTNASSGQTGACIAMEAYVQKAEVTLLRAESAPRPDIPVRDLEFTTHAELSKLVRSLDADLLVMPAAVADFGVARRKGKTPSGTAISLRLEPLPKVLALARCPTVAFKALSGASRADTVRAARRLLSGKVYIVVANDIRNAGRPSGSYLFVDKGGESPFEGTKDALAAELLRRIAICLDE